MKDRKYSDTSDAFLCDILSKKCNQFLSTFNNYKGRNFLQISQTLKFSTNQIKTSKAIVTRNKIIYSNTITQSAIREIAQQQSLQLRKKEQQLLEQLMRHIVINIKVQFEQIYTIKQQMKSDKSAFQCILQAMQQQYCLINQQLSRVRKYTKKKQIRDVINLQIDSISAQQFIEIIFCSLPQLKQFFVEFQIQLFTNQEIQQLRDQSDLIFQFVDLDALLEKRLKEKKLKKKNKKKKNKNNNNSNNNNNNDVSNKESISQSTCQGNQLTRKQSISDTSQKQNKVIQFLENLVIEQHRPSCNISDDWVKKLTLKYVK